MFNQNLIETSNAPVAILIGNLTQNVYDCKFYNVKNEFSVTNVSSYKFFSIFSNSLTLEACHRLLIIFSLLVLHILICTKNDPYLY